MEVCHTDSFLHSPAAQRLEEFVQKRCEQWTAQNDFCRMASFESFEQEVHTLVMALESELIGEELSRYDITAKEIEVDGKVYRRGVRYPETYLTAAGRVVVERN